jgi:hypothetical protein
VQLTGAGQAVRYLVRHSGCYGFALAEHWRPNMRIKLTACGTLTHGKKRRRSHAAAYPQR